MGSVLAFALGEIPTRIDSFSESKNIPPIVASSGTASCTIAALVAVKPFNAVYQNI
jgi:hypothetical protein